MIGSQVLMLTKGRAGANITDGVIGPALVAGARETGRGEGFPSALGLSRFFELNGPDLLQSVHA
jgi:hypothetical protein